MVSAPAAWATAPTPGARHELAQVERVAKLLGEPLMPWQSQVARVATERTDDGAGRRYPVVVVTVPRQSGKTTLMRTIMAQRAMTTPDFLAYYTAQTGKDATERWKDLIKRVTRSPILAPFVDVRLAAGSPGLTFTRTGSRISPFPPKATALHGYTPHLVMLDEVFSFDEQLGNDLMGAILPAQQTLADRQLWIVSTAGDASSVWLKEWVDRGRAASRAGAGAGGVAYFEWSAPAGLDLYNPATWWTYHPALGHTITEATLAEQAGTIPPGEWTRAYGNLWTSTRESVLDAAAWDALAEPRAPIPADVGPVAIAWDVHHDMSHASVYAAWTRAGVAHVATIASAAGLQWVARTVTQARQTIGAGRVVLAALDQPATRQVTDALARDGLEVRRIPTAEFAVACGAMLWRVNHDQIRHDGSANLAAAWSNAAARPSGDGGFILSHQHSTGAIDAAAAAVVAVRVADHEPLEAQPLIYTQKDLVTA